MEITSMGILMVFLIGCCLGTFAGILGTSVCVVRKQSEKRALDRMFKEIEKQKME